MTTSRRYFEEKWIPLDMTARTWEQHHVPQTDIHNSPTTPRRKQAHAPAEQDEDFAVEAGYSRPHLLQPRVIDMDEKPIISEKHVWGMVDGWGPKAGKWGKGAKAHE